VELSLKDNLPIRISVKSAKSSIILREFYIISKGGHRKVVQTIEEKKSLFEAYHDKLGHQGKNTTYNTIAKDFWWPSGMAEDVKAYVAGCDRCQRNTTLKLNGPQLHPIPVSPTMFHRWAIDLAGPFPVSKQPIHFPPVQIFLSIFLADPYFLRSIFPTIPAIKMQ